MCTRLAGGTAATWKFEVAFEFSLRTNGLDPKKDPARGSPGQFSDLRKGTLKIRKLTGCPTRGGLFRIKPFGPCLRISKSPSQTDAVGLTAWHMARANKVRLTGCGWRHVLRLSTRVVWLRRPELCYECADAMLSPHRLHHAQLVGAPGTNALAVC